MLWIWKTTARNNNRSNASPVDQGTAVVENKIVLKQLRN
jgi:hypothetical protein